MSKRRKLTDEELSMAMSSAEMTPLGYTIEAEGSCGCIIDEAFGLSIRDEYGFRHSGVSLEQVEPELQRLRFDERLRVAAGDRRFDGEGVLRLLEEVGLA